MNKIVFKNSLLNLTQKTVILFMTSIAVTACTTTKPAIPSYDQYVVGTGDRLKIDVYGDETLSGEFMVDVSGNISLPLVQRVHASGQTAEALEATIAGKLYPKYMNDPKVTVQVLQYGDVFILGEVRLPGKYPYAPNMTVMQSVAVAGGFTYRGTEGGATISRLINGKVKEYEFDKNERIMPGDTIYVGRRWF